MKKRGDSEPEFITATELGKRLGVSERAVAKAVKVGRLLPAYQDAKGKRWFVEKTAREQWGKNTLPPKNGAEQTIESPESSNSAVPGNDPVSVRVAREKAQVRILNFRARTLEQELVPIDQVAKLWERHVADAKKLLMALPVELRILIPALTPENAELIENRLAGILDMLANWKPGDRGK